MTESEAARPFTVIPADPLRVIAEDQNGKKYEISLQVAVLSVRATDKNDTSGNTIFELDFQTILQTKKVDQP